MKRIIVLILMMAVMLTLGKTADAETVLATADALYKKGGNLLSGWTKVWMRHRIFGDDLSIAHLFSRCCDPSSISLSTQ